jgi:hypothetical protein
MARAEHLKSWRVIGAVLVSAALHCGAANSAHAEDAVIATGQQSNGKARADILSLKRTEGDTLTLRFAIANENGKTLMMVLGNMRLIDLVNRRSYEPGVKSPDCNIPNGEKRICWAVFAAPGANVRSLNVAFDEDFGLISVPISN